MQPLQGITVLDLTRVLSGPYCTMLLGDMGARVIKIEQPGKGDDTRAWGPPFLQGESAYFLSINRNKESVTLDFKQPEGRTILDRLIAKSDVMVENFRPGSLGKLGLDHASIYFATGSAPSRMGNRHPTIVPYETFAASDGDFVIAVGNDDQWRRFCRVADLEDDEKFATNRSRVTRYAELKPILSDRLRTRTRAQWIEELTKAGVPCGSVRDLHEVFNDPQIA